MTNADSGNDLDFGRGELMCSSYAAAPSVKPTPSLRALKLPPFYALDIRPGEFSTVAGVATDAHGQILKDGYSPVPGLYAIGIDANSIFRGHYPGAGSAIGPAMTFGYILARELARSKERRGSDDETTKA